MEDLQQLSEGGLTKFGNSIFAGCSDRHCFLHLQGEAVVEVLGRGEFTAKFKAGGHAMFWCDGGESLIIFQGR